MSVLWQIARADGTTLSFAEAHIRSATRQLVNQGVDTVQIAFANADVFAAQPWGDLEPISILRDGVRWFQGHNFGFIPTASGAVQGTSITLSGPWWQLEKLTYMQPVTYVSSLFANELNGGPNSPPVDDTAAFTGFPTYPQFSSTIFLGEDSLAQRVSSREMILEAISYTIARGGTFQLGTVDPGIFIPREELRGVTCGEIIRRCLRWTPGYSTWFDYSTTPATLHIRSRANRALKILNAADAEIEEVSLTARLDLMLQGVRIEYLRTHERGDLKFRTLDVDEAGPDPSGIGALVVPVELYGSQTWTTDSQHPELPPGIVSAEAIPVGVAAQIYSAFATPPMEGTVKLVRQEVGGELWIALALRVTGGRPEWATMRGDIQTVTDSTATGRTEITVGPPQHLGPQDLIALLRTGRAQLPSATESYMRAGGSTPATPTIPPTATDGRLLFGPGNPPNVVLARRIYTRDVGSIGQGTFQDYTFDYVAWYDEPGGEEIERLSASDLGISQVVIWHNLRVGRINDVDTGVTIYFQNPGYNAPPPDPRVYKYYASEQ